ncbi:acyltransferase [Acinetobacter wuhouensis]|uniref:lysophospholipid acyltransferase family protein n=1 Tax=Acinetobacter wuhouensis TaxID=1879050 RepID=UPI00083B1B91|nr:lysophospholipid acyltransferase family protein [Acinetobacter wuhouensis]AXQ21491.1 acyltransferase [Acinetobacter wuhouensis]
MSENFPNIPDQVPQRGTTSSRNLFKKLYLAQGWGFVGEFPNLPKAVVFIAPHTSNFDGLYAFLAMLGIGVKVTIFGKDSLFKTPLKGLFEWIGVIPVERDSPHGLTQQIVDVIHQQEKIWIAIAPEGTRNRAEKIKSGFYHIAMGANIPIAIFSFDYEKKLIHCLGTLQPTGDYDQDLVEILNRFNGKFSPKHPKLLSIPLQKLLKNS